eukprot:jgi/Bigna1/127034/aug1.3_g1742
MSLHEEVEHSVLDQGVSNGLEETQSTEDGQVDMKRMQEARDTVKPENKGSGSFSGWLPPSDILKKSTPKDNNVPELSVKQRQKLAKARLKSWPDKDDDLELRKTFLKELQIPEEIDFFNSREAKQIEKSVELTGSEHVSSDGEETHNPGPNKKILDKRSREGYKRTVDDMGIGGFDDYLDEMLACTSRSEDEGSIGVDDAQGDEDENVDSNDDRDALGRAVDWVKDGQEDRLNSGKKPNRKYYSKRNTHQKKGGTQKRNRVSSDVRERAAA